MLTIKTYLDRDEYGGRGVFAAAPVRKGEIVWKYSEATTRILTIEEYKTIVAAGGKMADTLRRYCYPAKFVYKGLEQRVLLHDLDNGSFMNHSDTPNTGQIVDPSHPHYDKRDNLNIALRDIAKGEQLTYDYFAFVDGDLAEWGDVETCMQFLIDMRHPRTLPQTKIAV